MGIITLTTDLGSKDFYLASVKGSILLETPDVQVIDITHAVSPFNIAQGAFLFRNAYRYFPKKTVHVLGVNCDYAEKPRFMAMAYSEQYFVGPDNGIFSLIFESTPTKAVEITIPAEPRTLHFALKDVLAKAACHLASGGTLDALGPIHGRWEQKMNLQPVVSRNFIRGTVIYIDEFHNVITNITRRVFLEVSKDRSFLIRMKRNETINKISYHYGEVEEGEKLSLFGISDHLEIAINKGRASGLLGLRMDDPIQIDFEDHPIA